MNLMILMMVVVLIFPLLKMIMPANAAIKYIAGKVDVGLVAIIFAVIALLLKLAPQKEAVPISVLCCALYNFIVAMVL